MKRRAGAAVVGCWLLGCTATTELDNLESGATATSSSTASTSVSSATVGSGGGAGSAAAGGNGGAAGCDYATHVLADTPLAYWRLDELVTPDAYDATANGNDGVYVNGVTLGEPGAFTHSGTAVKMDGSGRVDLGDRFDFPGTLSFSLEAWVKPSAEGGALLGKLDYLNMDYAGYILYLSQSGPVSFSRRPGGLTQGRSLMSDAFAHVVATYDGVTMRLYIDGALQDNLEHLGAIIDAASPFYVGDAASWANFTGSMDEVAVYDYALAPSQITDHYSCALDAR